MHSGCGRYVRCHGCVARPERGRFPKSVTPDRIRENIDIFDFELSAADVEDITVLNKNERTGPGPGKFDGR